MRPLLTTVLALSLLSFCVAPAHAYSIATVGGKEVKWSIFDVGYYLDSNGWSGISNGSDLQALVQSFNDWQAVSCSKLKFHKVGDTTTTNVLPTGPMAMARTNSSGRRATGPLATMSWA